MAKKSELMRSTLAATVVLISFAVANATDISPVPLSTIGSSGAVKPNIMVVLDNSGSMDWDYVGDYVNDKYCKADSSGNFNKGNCCSNDDTSSTGGNGSCWSGSAPFTYRGHPPFLNSSFNGMAYNPAVWYKPPKKSDGSSWPSIGSPWTAVKNDAYNIQNTGSINLTTGFPDTMWCSDSGLTNCIRNGNYLLPGFIGGVEYKYFKATTGTGTGLVAQGSPSAPTLSGTKIFGPHYYGIIPGEFCTTDLLKTCRAQTAADATYKFPASVRWCSDAQLQTCQSTKTDTYIYPRYPGRVVAATSEITIKLVSKKSNVSSITVDGKEILNTAIASNTSSSTVAKNVASAINACTKSIPTGSGCKISGYSASSSGSVVTLTAPPGYAPTGTPVVTGTGSATAFNGNAGSIPGSFVRVDIIPSINSYGDPANTSGFKHPDRLDCAGTTCTYTEEMTNFANWWTYYHSRLQTMKSALSRSFADVTGSYNVGFALLSDIGYSGTVTSSSHGMFPAVFSGTNRSDWYSKLVTAKTTNATPLRTALDNMGKMYANQAPYNFTGDDRVVKYSCQQNFTMLTTDGYWNQSYSGSVTNNDSTSSSSRFCTRANACLDPSSASQTASLADVALYWYNGGSNSTTVSLRPDIDTSMDKAGKVPFTTADPNTHLHMTTYTLGLGISGNVTYEKSYDSSPQAGGDFAQILNGTANWPQAQADSASAVDDLWHAAINGHGKYFSARTPDEVVQGLKDALTSMQVRTGAAAASSTSTPNVSQIDNDIFSTTFTTGKWYGEVFAQKLDTSTGATLPAKVWSSSLKVGQKVDESADTRNIYFSPSTGVRKSFLFSEMTSSEKAWFNNKGSSMSQYSSLNTTDKAIANNGENLVNWLRGQFGYADDKIYRSYSLYGSTLDPVNMVYNKSTNPYIILGDVATGKPVYVRRSYKSYSIGGYSSFRLNNESRAGSVYIAANDGMLHNFNANTGEELWAYAPRITMPKLFNQASKSYAANHQYTVDGSPEQGDIQIDGTWKTILVGGLNAGGRGYYALDITNPTDPKPLWEFCSDPSICASNDADLGLTYGNPQIGMWNDQWVVLVTSGYNNVPNSGYTGSGGDGKGYLYILRASDGVVLKKITTDIGSTSTPSGLAKITAISENPQTDPVITYVYGGDTLGNMFRFDLTKPSVSSIPVIKMATLGASRPITTRPDVTLCPVSGSKQRVVVWGTGRLLGESDVNNTDTQSFYAVKDSGSELGALNEASSMVKQMWDSSKSTSTSYARTNLGVDWTKKNGWYIDFSMRPGERVNIDPKITLGEADGVTNFPSSSSDDCSIGGSSNEFHFPVCGSTEDSDPTIESTLLSATSPSVGFIVIRLPSGKLISKNKLADGSTADKEMSQGTSSPARKAGWRTVKNK